MTVADQPDCVTQGTDLEDALCMAQEAVSLHVAGMIADGEMLLEPSTLAVYKMHDEQEYAKKVIPCLKAYCGSISLLNWR